MIDFLKQIIIVIVRFISFPFGEILFLSTIVFRFSASDKLLRLFNECKSGKIRLLKIVVKNGINF